MTNQGKYINTEKTITEQGLKNSSAWIVPKNSILYSIYASVGFVAINNINLSTSQAIYSIILKDNIDIDYIYYYLLNLKKSIHKYIETGTQGNLNSKIVQNFTIKIPTLNEQKRISNFLSLVDKKIELLEKKYENQKIFLKEFRNKIINKHLFVEDCWNEHNIKEYIVEYKEKVKSNCNLPILSSTLSGIYLQNEYFNKNINNENFNNYKIVPKNYFTYRSMSDTGKFKFNIQNIVDKGIISPAYPVFTTKNINDKYLYEFLNYSNSIKKQILKLKEGGTRYTLSFSKFKNLKIEVPSIETQNTISKYIDFCYKKELFLEKEINKMKEFKKGLLQKMFV